MQLRTPFGGGKTHSLLALYHLARHRDSAARVPELDGVPDPGPVRTAILSGEYLDPQRGRAVDGRSISTLWGELAYQLGGWEAYDALLFDGDEGVPPGGELLARLLGDEPTLLLLDEVLIYVVKARALRRGDTNAGQQALLFVQNLTEAVNQRPRSAMVYSLQASVGEAVGEEALLSQLEKIAGRIDARREPVSGDEVLRVVQRRLFEDIGPEGVRREVARAYAEQLRGHLEATAETDSDRVEARQAGDRLEQRVADAYPFHPELIDLMNHRWGALPTYQRTRGALQFLARVVHSLWASRGEAAPQALIGPGDVDLADESVREAFLEQVGEANQYRSVIEADFLTGDAGTKRIDERIGRDAPALERLRVGTRVATSIMLLSFGGQREDQRGALEREVVEATLVPSLDANNVREALRDMQREALLYLHHRGARYRFDTVANINSLIRGEREGLSVEEVLARVREELERGLQQGADRHEIVVWPDTSAQVRDDGGRFRIVYLPPDWSPASMPLGAAVLSAGHRTAPLSQQPGLRPAGCSDLRRGPAGRAHPDGDRAAARVGARNAHPRAARRPQRAHQRRPPRARRHHPGRLRRRARAPRPRRERRDRLRHRRPRHRVGRRARIAPARPRRARDGRLRPAHRLQAGRHRPPRRERVRVVRTAGR